MSDGKIIVSKYSDTPVVTAFVDNSLEYLSFVRKSELHDIYLGKVDHIVSNIDGAFIRYSDNNMGYLSLKNINAACITNRDFAQSPKLRNGDEIIVQVESEAVKLKKAKLTTSISISGRYAVLTLGRNGLGVSLKLDDQKRHFLQDICRDIYENICNERFSSGFDFSFVIIIRTNAADIPEDKITEEISADINKLCDRLGDIFKMGNSRVTGSRLFSPDEETSDNGYMDHELDEDTNRILNKLIGQAKAFLKTRDILSADIKKDSGIYGINSEIESLTRNKVWLKSGGFLIIEQLESFNAIDVNTGKAIKGKGNILKKINLEAADEIMRQVRLRNLTGMILIDFINMQDKADYDELSDHVKKLCRMDNIHTNFIDITALGIMELPRNKNDKSLKEILSEI